MRASLFTGATVALFSCHALAHGGDHGTYSHQPEVPADADWTIRHMAEEHHIAYFDHGSFFNMHDFDSNGEWSRDEISKFYGLQHDSNSHVSLEDKERAVSTVINLYDRDGSGTISYSEYVISAAQNIALPDLGYGPGHHGDDEYEYEIHHFEKYHGDDTTEEDLIHPEDIEHFKMHDLLDEQMERQEEMDRMQIVEQNIPRKFWRE